MRKIRYNSPVVLSFALLSMAVLLLNRLTSGWTNAHVFSVYRGSLTDPLFYFRLFGHVLGHANWAHYSGNMILLLLTGPMLEEKYGSRRIVMVIAITALVTGLTEVLFFPGTALLGASGVVFAFILLSSVTGSGQEGIPLTLIVIAVIYLGGQIYEGITQQDNVSHLTHILGGVIGGGAGLALRHKK